MVQAAVPLITFVSILMRRIAARWYGTWTCPLPRRRRPINRVPQITSVFRRIIVLFDIPTAYICH
jgi:hypothetical protein